MSEPVLDVPLKTEFKINIEGGVWEMTISNFNIEGASAQTTLRIMLEWADFVFAWMRQNRNLEELDLADLGNLSS